MYFFGNDLGEHPAHVILEDLTLLDVFGEHFPERLTGHAERAIPFPQAITIGDHRYRLLGRVFSLPRSRADDYLLARADFRHFGIANNQDRLG